MRVSGCFGENHWKCSWIVLESMWKGRKKCEKGLSYPYMRVRGPQIVLKGWITYANSSLKVVCQHNRILGSTKSAASLCDLLVFHIPWSRLLAFQHRFYHVLCAKAAKPLGTMCRPSTTYGPSTHVSLTTVSYIYTVVPVSQRLEA